MTISNTTNHGIEKSGGQDALHPFDSRASSLSGSAIENPQILSGKYWGELRTFLALAKAKSLNKAAEELGTSHMTVGRDIRRLQDVMGAQLVVLSKAGAKLTARGERLTKTLLRFDQELFSLSNDLKNETRNAEGLVRISMTDGLGAIFVVPALRDLSVRFPRLQIQMKSTVNFRSLRENQTDLMIGFSGDPSSDLICKRLGYLHFLPFATRSYIERKGVPTIDNIEEHEFVDSEIYSSQAPIWKTWHELTARGRIAHYCDASISYGLMVKAGLGIGLLGNFNALEASGVPLALETKVTLPLFLIGVAERLESKPVSIVANFLTDIFGPHNPWFSPDLKTEVTDEDYNQGYRMLFNL